MEPLPPDPYTSDPFSPLFVIFRPLTDPYGYGVDSDGNVWSCRKARGIGKDQGFRSVIETVWRKLKPGLNSSGYCHLSRTLAGGRTWQTKNHCLVLETFVGSRPRGFLGCHNDGNKTNNRLSNLRWDTHANNVADMVRHKTTLAGTKNISAKLTEDQVREIRKRLSGGEQGNRLAIEYGMSQATMSKIHRRQSWQHI